MYAYVLARFLVFSYVPLFLIHHHDIPASDVFRLLPLPSVLTKLYVVYNTRRAPRTPPGLVLVLFLSRENELRFSPSVAAPGKAGFAFIFFFVFSSLYNGVMSSRRRHCSRGCCTSWVRSFAYYV